MRHRLRDRAGSASSPPCRRRPLGQPTARLNQPRRPVVRSERRAGRRPAAVECDSSQQTEMSAAPQCGAEHISIDKDWLGPGAPYEGVFLSVGELDDLLGVEEQAADLLSDGELPEEAPLADLLQQLVGYVDVSSPTHHRSSQAEARPYNMDAASRPGAHCPSNKNALAARLNRLRKKEYVSGLEARVTRLAEENQQLQHERRSLGARVRELEEEARYLRAVLANDSALSQLLGRLTGLGGVKLSTSLFSDPPSGGDHDYALPGIQREQRTAAAAPGGVCLHVDKEKVSVEFCSLCARNASSAAKIFSFR